MLIASGPASEAKQVLVVDQPPDQVVRRAGLNAKGVAEQIWRRVSDRAPALVRARAPEIAHVTIKNHVFYRLRVADFACATTATKFYGEVSVAENACIRANF